MTSLTNFAKQHISSISANINDYMKMSKLFFDKTEYTKNNKGFDRHQMPQIDFQKFSDMLDEYAQHTEILKTSIRTKDLCCTQTDVNLSKVLQKIAASEKVNPAYAFIVDKNNYLLDGHHTHVQTLIENPEQYVNIIKFTNVDVLDLIRLFNNQLKDVCTYKKDIRDTILQECFEDYGQQGAESITGMGDVVLPQISTSSEIMNRSNVGSGDIPQTITKKIDYGKRLAALKKRREE